MQYIFVILLLYEASSYGLVSIKASSYELLSIKTDLFLLKIQLGITEMIEQDFDKF